jgi:hypothetical protein
MLHFLLFSFAMSYVLRWKKEQKPFYQWNENIEYTAFGSDKSYYHLPVVLESTEKEDEILNEETYQVVNNDNYEDDYENDEPTDFITNIFDYIEERVHVL